MGKFPKNYKGKAQKPTCNNCFTLMIQKISRFLLSFFPVFILSALIPEKQKQMSASTNQQNYMEYKKKMKLFLEMWL